jgi:hypothetical protein
MPRATKGSSPWENGKTKTGEKRLDDAITQILTNNTALYYLTSILYTTIHILAKATLSVVISR